MVTEDVYHHEQTQETLAPRRNLGLGGRRLEAGRVRPAADVVKRLRGRGQPR